MNPTKVVGSHSICVPAVLMALLVACFAIGCRRDPVRPSGEVRWETGLVDFVLAWSRDGQWIAFRRVVPSQYGPPGVYIVDRTGTRVRLVYPGADLFFPREATFAPNNRFLAMVDGSRQLMILDLITLEVAYPMHTDTDVIGPDWSPDGRSILYSRFYNGNPSTTADSMGLFLFEVSTGTTHQLRSGPDYVFTRYPTWSPDGGMIAMDELVGPIEALSVMNADGTGHRFLLPAKSLNLYDNIQWYRSANGSSKIFFDWTSERGGPYVINPDGTGLTPFWHRSNPAEAFLSPTGTEFVIARPGPTNHVWVLYVGRIEDATDQALRQVTRYEPPPGAPSTLELGER